MQTLYVGLGAAYFVNETADFAGVGTPGPNGWQWTPQAGDRAHSAGGGEDLSQRTHRAVPVSCRSPSSNHPPLPASRHENCPETVDRPAGGAGGLAAAAPRPNARGRAEQRRDRPQAGHRRADRRPHRRSKPNACRWRAKCPNSNRRCSTAGPNWPRRSASRKTNWSN